jgi:sugar phosphate isomerase/epimerase
MTNRNDWQTSISTSIRRFSKERMLQLQKSDIHFVELGGGMLEYFENYSEVSNSIFKTAAEYDVTIRSVHLPFCPKKIIDPAGEDKTVRDNFVKEQIEIVKISADRGAKIAVVHPSTEPYRIELRDRHMSYSIEALSKVNETAQKCGILLAIENLPRTCLCRDCNEIKRFVDEIPNIYFCFDSNHSLIDDNTDIIKAMGEKIVATHISDYDFKDEMHVLPGKGKNDWEKIMRCLEEANYSGTWNYEASIGPDDNLKVFVDNRKALLSGEIK